MSLIESSSLSYGTEWGDCLPKNLGDVDCTKEEESDYASNRENSLYSDASKGSASDIITVRRWRLEVSELIQFNLKSIIRSLYLTDPFIIAIGIDKAYTFIILLG